MNCWKLANLEQTVNACANEVEGFTDLVFKVLSGWSEAESSTIYGALIILCDWIDVQERRYNPSLDILQLVVDSMKALSEDLTEYGSIIDNCNELVQD
ncbi:hypothetical protein PTKIN_Ptkin04bG0109100 [Pterospermum kingtungense]